MPADSQLYDWANRPIPDEHLRGFTRLEEIFAREAGAGSGGGPFVVGRPFQQNAWVYAIVSDGAAAFAELPQYFYRRTGRRRLAARPLVPIENHPLYELLESPNDLEDSRRFREMWFTYLFTWGNVWAQKGPLDSRGIPAWLILFGSDAVRPLRQGTYGELIAWRVRLGGKVFIVPLEDMVHWKIPTPYDPVMGLAPHIALRAVLDADYNRVLFDKFFFRNRATPDAILTYKPGPLNKAARDMIYQAWREYHMGTEHAGGLAVVGGDFDLKVLGISQSQAQFIESRKLSREEIAAAYHYPVQLLNSQEGSGLGREELAQARIMRHERFIRPAAERFIGGFNREIVWSVDKRVQLGFDYDSLPLLIPVLREKAEVYRLLVSLGQPPNAVAARLNMGLESVDGGDDGYMPANMVPIGSTPAGASEPRIVPGVNSVPMNLMEMHAAPASIPGPHRRSTATDPGDSAFIVTALRKQLRRTLYELRNEALREGKVFHVGRAKMRWARLILPSVAAAMLLGAQEVERDFLGGGPVWIDQANGELPALLSGLRQHAERIGFGIDSWDQEAERIVRRELGVISQLASACRTDEEFDVHVKEVFSNIDKRAKGIAGRCVRIGRNSGRYLVAAAAELKCVMAGPCAATHENIRYPGDSRVEFEQVEQCRCVLIVEGKQNEQHERTLRKLPSV